jgi:hypothetical protein
MFALVLDLSLFAFGALFVDLPDFLEFCCNDVDVFDFFGMPFTDEFELFSLTLSDPWDEVVGLLPLKNFGGPKYISSSTFGLVLSFIIFICWLAVL